MIMAPKNRLPKTLIGLLALATLVRIGLAAVSLGSNDIFTWYQFAGSIEEQGILDVYRTQPMFNHPPMAGAYAKEVFALSGSRDTVFAFLFKLPAIAADAGIAILLWKRWSRAGDPRRAELAAAAFAWSPVAILISGYHGNTDSIVAFLAFLAVYLAGSRGMSFMAGVALAAACNIKIVPLVLALPVVLTYTSRNGARFVAGMTLGLVPIGIAALAVGPVFFENVLAYNSLRDNWGILFLMLQGSNLPAIGEPIAVLGDAHVALGRYLILGCAAVIGWTFRQSLYDSAALVMALFLVLAPGFGVQYLIYVLPFLLAVHLRWGICFSILGGLFLLLLYAGWGNGAIPLSSLFGGPIPVPVALTGLLAWGSLVMFVIWGLRPRNLGPAA